MENEDFDLNTPAGAQSAVRHLLARQDNLISQLAEIQQGAQNGDNVEKLAEGMRGLRQEIAEIRAASKQADLDGRIGADSNISRYTFDKGAVSRTVPALALGDDKRLVLRGFVDKERGYVPGLLDDDPTFEQQGGLQRALDDYALVRELRAVGKGHEKRYQECPQARERVLQQIRTLPGKAAEAVERAFVDSTGVGGDWIDTKQLTTLEREEFRISDAEMLFDELSITGKSASMPYSGFGAVPYIKARATGDNPPNYKTSSPETAETSLTAQALAVHIQVDEDAAEDAYIAVLPLIRQDMGEAMSDGLLDALINGSTASSHPDTLAGWTAEGRWPSGITGLADDHRRVYMGLRHQARSISGASYSGAGDYNTFAGIQTMRATLDRPFRTRRESLVLLVNDLDYIKNLSTLTELVTVDKYGSLATILTGEVARVGGIPVVPVGFLTGDQATTGLYTGTSASKTSRLLVARNMVKRVRRKDTRIEIDREIRNGMISLVATARRGTYFMGNGKKTVINAYNIPV